MKTKTVKKTVKATKKMKTTAKTTVKPAAKTGAFKSAANLITSVAKSAARRTSGAIKSVTSAKSATTTTIEARIDVGFGNNLFVRGQGAGLSWERGTPLTCVSPNTWQLSAKAAAKRGEKVTVKLLLNDAVWARGDDVVVTPGQRVEIQPAF